MSKLATLAGTKKLTGPVTVTKADGTNTIYDNAEAAEEGAGSMSLFHHRGAFYEKGCQPRGHAAQAPATAKEAPAPAATPTIKKKRRSASSD